MTYLYPDNITGLSGLFTYANNVTSSVFGYYTLIIMFALIWLSTLAYGTGRSFITACFATLIMSLVWYSLGLINMIPVLLIAIAMSVAVYVNFKGN